ncbi:MAG: monooxygenase [Caldilinea sp. CFX5]|nr:monooxygenase [Caldilinea sp. CFX5]
MVLTLLQIDFPANGPWGDAMAAAYSGLAAVIAETPGLLWKIWTEDEATRCTGGIYLFVDRPSAEAYLAIHTARLASFGITEIRAKLFAVNAPLTAVTRGAPITADLLAAG